MLTGCIHNLGLQAVVIPSNSAVGSNRRLILFMFFLFIIFFYVFCIEFTIICNVNLRSHHCIVYSIFLIGVLEKEIVWLALIF